MGQAFEEQLFPEPTPMEREPTSMQRGQPSTRRQQPSGGREQPFTGSEQPVGRQPQTRPRPEFKLTGTEADDVLRGDDSDNTYQAGGGDDLLLASPGNNTVIGGDGNDRLSYEALTGPITLMRGGNVLKADGSIDTRPDLSIETVIGARGERNGIDASGGSTASIDVDLSKERLTINGLPVVGSASITVKRFTDVIGSEVSDTLSGHYGSNDLNGSAGDDILIGLGGADRLTGGAGADTFKFSPGDSSARRFDKITDLEIGSDQIMGWEKIESVTQIGSTNSLRRRALSSLLNSTDFRANDAASFSMGERTFMAMNDGRDGFQRNSDTLIEITGFTGNLADLSII